MTTENPDNAARPEQADQSAQSEQASESAQASESTQASESAQGQTASPAGDAAAGPEARADEAETAVGPEVRADEAEAPVGPAVPLAGPDASLPADGEALAPPPAPARRARRLGVVAGAGVLLVAVVAGVGYTVVTVNGADRDAGAPSWRFPKQTEAKAGAEKDDKGTGLRPLLLPYDDNERKPGPDIGEFGSDAELSGDQATALRKESLVGLPRTQRRELERQIDKNPTKGIAMRSYVATDSAGDVSFTLEVDLARMSSQRAARTAGTTELELFDAVSIFRDGPEIKGYKNAGCVMPPADSDEKLDMMICSAYIGDVLISATAEAAKPLPKKEVAEMLRAQLDRIKDPGEAV